MYLFFFGLKRWSSYCHYFLWFCFFKWWKKGINRKRYNEKWIFHKEKSDFYRKNSSFSEMCPIVSKGMKRIMKFEIRLDSLKNIFWTACLGFSIKEPNSVEIRTYSISSYDKSVINCCAPLKFGCYFLFWFLNWLLIHILMFSVFVSLLITEYTCITIS